MLVAVLRRAKLPIVLLAVTACGGGRADIAPEPPPAEARPLPLVPQGWQEAATLPEAPGIEWTLHLPLDQGVPLKVEVSARASGPALSRWSTAVTVGSIADEVTARDVDGEVPVVLAHIEGRTEVRFERAVHPPLRLRYEMRPPAAFDARFGLGPGSLYLDGHTLLVPTGAPVLPLTVRVVTDERYRPDVASTLGLGPGQSVDARPVDLWDVSWLVGRLDVARFEAREGDDFTACLGPRGFDARWVGAEMAVARSRVDDLLAAIPESPFAMLVLVGPEDPTALPFVAHRSGQGVMLVANGPVEWGADARLPVAQLMARRWLGGRLRFTHPDGIPDDWLTLGFTRAIAQQVLFRMGSLTSQELARDLTRLTGALALATRTTDPDDEERRLIAMARGALYAAGLSARLSRASGPTRTLGALLMPLLRRAAEEGGLLPVDAFRAALVEALGEEERARFDETVLAPTATLPAVPADAFGPCLRPGRTTHRRFALGFDPPATAAGEPFEVSGVVAGGPAARAGLADGDAITSLRLVAGDPETDVVLSVRRPDGDRELRYRPFDLAVPGPSWARAPRIDEERCAP